jgi:3-oxoacyl-[acyl-carrier-protein] synthase-3
MSDLQMGIVAAGMYLPDTRMTAAEIAEQSGLPEWVVRDKLGINEKRVAAPGIHPNQMAVWAVEDCLAKTDIHPEEIDVVLCTTDEWKEYNLWTAGIDLLHQIGATNAWGMDVHIRCATTIAALKTARSIMADDPDVDTILIAGGYTISDFINLENLRTSFLFNIGSGAGALLVRRDWPANHVLGTHLMSDGSMSRHVIVPASGTVRHPTDQAVADGDFYFDLVEPEAMKNRLNEVSMSNWMHCVDEALRKSGPKEDGSPLTREDLDFLNMVLVKPSAHREILGLLALTENQSVYTGDYGHIGEQDSIINIIEGEKQGRLEPGDLMVIIGAGIGYVWGAGIVRWGPC